MTGSTSEWWDTDELVCVKRRINLWKMALIYAVALSGALPGIGNSEDLPRRTGKITKAQAEHIALSKMPGGRVRSAELETVRGEKFWSVYVGKPGAKNAKEIRVDARSGRILTVQTERPADQAEEPAKSQSH